jgi:hypothetical protein
MRVLEIQKPGHQPRWATGVGEGVRNFVCRAYHDRVKEHVCHRNKAAATQSAIDIPQELLDRLIPGPMTQEGLESVFRDF